MNKIELEEQCSRCHGTGLYVGMAEKDGFAVVCYQCKGTGKYKFVHVYEEFTGRKDREGIETVIECNPGIVVGKKDGLDFGGIPYEQWKQHGLFPPKSEMRQYTCPAWWYQNTNYKLKPNWKECLLGGTFSSCKNFPDKAACWNKWDKEFGRE